MKHYLVKKSASTCCMIQPSDHSEKDKTEHSEKASGFQGLMVWGVSRHSTENFREVKILWMMDICPDTFVQIHSNYKTKSEL